MARVCAASADLRLRSMLGRFVDATASWVVDSPTSPAIDAGDPASAYDLEPTSNGQRANLGYDGNTATASKSPDVRACRRSRA